MNESAKNTEKPRNVTAIVAHCCAKNVVRGTAVSYDIHSSGHSLIAASACRNATATPHTSGCRQSTRRRRSMKNRPTPIPPNT